MNYDEIMALDFTDIRILPPVSRRRFLKIFTGGIAILLFGRDLMPLLAQGKTPAPEEFNAFLWIAEDGTVKLFTGKIEMGQGTISSLPMMLADELDVPLERVEITMGDTDLCPWDMGTFGSLTIRHFGPVLLKAAATARQVLVELAAEKLSVAVDQLETRSGVVQEKGGGRSLTYAQLAKGQKITRPLQGEVRLKTAAEYRVMGKDRLHQDARLKVTGAAKYAGDLREEGMFYARILRPPAHGAKRVSLDVEAARKLPGILVVEEGEFVAVLHENPEQAAAALEKIVARWDIADSPLDEKTIHEHLVKNTASGETVQEGGDLAAGGAASSKVVEATYKDGYVAHAAMETHTALAKMDNGRLIIHASTQTPYRLQSEAAQEFKLKEEDVRVIPPFVGGGFGGKSFNLQAIEAARLTRAVNRPVMVMWTRDEEFFEDTFRPASVINVRAGLSNTGRISFWDYGVHSAGQRGCEHFYAIPHHRTQKFGEGWRGAPGLHPFRVGAWRAPANNSNTFARESHIEVLARAAGQDPLEFRLAHLEDKKMIAVLKAAAEKFNWKPGPSGNGRGFGIACGVDADTSVVVIVDITVDSATGQIQVKRAVVAQDMGLCVNPAGSIIQAEGCVMMGLGYTLSEEIRFQGGNIKDRNFDTYQLPRFSWTPEIEVVILPRQDQPPAGGGEPAIICMGGAVANAVHDAIGIRLYQTPLTPQRVLAALKK